MVLRQSILRLLSRNKRAHEARFPVHRDQSGGYRRAERRDFRHRAANRGGAELTGTNGMFGALEVLKLSHGEPLPPQMQAFGINTDEGSGLTRLFMSHPPLDARIAALKAAPGA
jgi:hypothetical protein